MIDNEHNEACVLGDFYIDTFNDINVKWNTYTSILQSVFIPSL